MEFIATVLDWQSLDRVAGGNGDGGVPPQVVKVTTRESTTVTVSGSGNLSIKKVANVSGEGTYSETTTSSSTSTPCAPDGSGWKGVPYR
ncbi:MAG TPA: hypothetical protein VGF45_24715 [Polyangia bacterium]